MEHAERTVGVVFRGMRFKDLLEVQHLNIRNSTENFLLGTFLSTLSTSYGTSFVADLGGKIVGYSEAVAFADRGRGQIYSICVDGAFRRRGIGRRLINLSVESIRAELEGKEACEIDLHVRASNAEAIGLYKSVGFVVCEANIPYYEFGGLAHRMSLTLGVCGKKALE
ncbi:N-TERMINAL ACYLTRANSFERASE COMPLEX SUBUNIT ARD1 [Encephalitozoon cuniculi GB-M1]|uniref:N-TERMINAL ACYLTRANSFERASE COMPLEX SUBUNIT ARD1 n=2 Tax=Encephalitozoon cuniculi TaxID=6035 RepID=Q8SRR9_ENCCU|nr:N-acetyltransferase [Encephalitozoon cuniculi GB-M1]KMV65942.1 N-acetyltransferase [Encephalitozoon cuniculi EcunIII-L]CAD25406.3 N-TERMINAL ACYLTRANSFERASE COMPLEX SUBUNIT ARD1 [Encephalitozoon cuniculi GB-M1]